KRTQLQNNCKNPALDNKTIKNQLKLKRMFENIFGTIYDTLGPIQTLRYTTSQVNRYI
ncbi:hypothetical protein L9F63_023746, partial [Diploptera punctata]